MSFLILFSTLCHYATAQDVVEAQVEKSGTKSETPCTSCESIAKAAGTAKYRIIVKYRNGDGSLVLHIVPQGKTQLDRDGLMATACKLRKDFAQEANVFVRIFDNKTAAKRWVDSSTQHKPPQWQTYAKSFKAFYSWKPKENQNFVVWDFDPFIRWDQQKNYAHADFCVLLAQ